jgi:hypothetical protein
MPSSAVTPAMPPSDAPRASQTPLARNQQRYAVACGECKNWFLAHKRDNLYCPYCAEVRRMESRRSARRWAGAYQRLHALAVEQGLAYDTAASRKGD